MTAAVETTNDSWSVLLSGRNGLRSIALAGGVAVHAINVYLVTTILPSIVRDIGGIEFYAWNMTLFVMASILGSALSPKMILSLGLRSAFVVTMIIFMIGTAICAMAPRMEVLLLGRTVQGLGGGFLLGLSYSAVRIVFDSVLWPKAMVLISSMWGIATLIGPTIGGVFAEGGHWRLAFWSVIPVVLGLLFLVLTQIKGGRHSTQDDAGIPFGKLSLLAVSVVIISWASLYKNNLAINLGGVLVAIVLTVLVGRSDRVAQANILPRGTYKRFSPLAVLYGCVALLSLGVTIELYIPYFLQHIHHQSPLWGGYFMASLSFAWSIGSFLSAGKSPQTTEAFVKGGPILAAVGLVLLAILMPMDLQTLVPGGAYWLLVPLMAIGCGIGVCWPHLLTEVFHAAPKGQENLASAAIITVQLYSLAMGGALSGMLANLSGFDDPSNLNGTRVSAAVVFGVLALGPIIASWLVFKRQPQTHP